MARSPRVPRCSRLLGGDRLRSQIGQSRPCSPRRPRRSRSRERLLKSLARRPRLSLDAEYGASSTTSDGDVRIIAYAVVYLFLRNEERAGEAKHCKVEISQMAPTRVFRLDGPARAAATEHLLNGDTHTIVWQPGLLAPGGVAELQLRSDRFPFTESVCETARVTADRMDPFTATLVLRVERYDEKNVELSAAVE